MEVGGNERGFPYSVGHGKETDAVFTGQISASAPRRKHVAIGDEAGFHHEQYLEHGGRLPANVSLLTVPPHTRRSSGLSFDARRPAHYR